jgi:hypothetical protein
LKEGALPRAYINLKWRMSLRAEHSVVVLPAIAVRSTIPRKIRFDVKGKGHSRKGHKNPKSSKSIALPFI